MVAHDRLPIDGRAIGPHPGIIRSGAGSTGRPDGPRRTLVRRSPMSHHHTPNDGPDPDDGIDRRGFLECMTWAGTGVLWMLGGGVPRSVGLASAQAADAAHALTFLQISDSHVG